MFSLMGASGLRQLLHGTEGCMVLCQSMQTSFTLYPVPAIMYCCPAGPAAPLQDVRGC